MARAVPKTIYYGGGAFPSLEHEQLLSLSRLSPRKLAIWGSLADNDHLSQCGLVFVVRAHVLIRRDGSFSTSGPTGGQSGRFHLSGRFVSPDEARGTARATYTDGRAFCDTRKFAWHVFAPSLRGGSGVLGGHAFYGGTTSQRSARLASVRLPVLIKVNRDKSKVAEFALMLTAPCKSGAHLYTDREFFVLNKPIANDEFHHQSHGSFAFSASETGQLDASFNGRFARRRVTGDGKVSITITKNSDGSTVDTCGTNVHWQATRRHP